MDDGFEKFEISDYDLDQAYNPLQKKKRFSKNEQIYGMWADKEESDEESEAFAGFSGSSSKSGRKQYASLSKRKDYSAPVNFVSGGIKQGDKVTKDDQEEEQQEEEDEESVSIEINASRFASRRKEQYSGSKSKHQKSYSFTSESFAGLRSKSGHKPNQMLADWEKYTKGIGSKLLQKMGHKHGSGLGKEGQGIAEPIKAALRPGRGAVGLYGPEVKGPEIRKGGDESAEKQDEERDRNKKPNWMKKADVFSGTKQKKESKPQYKTWDDIVNSDTNIKNNWTAEGQSTLKIIDMTGKEQRVYSGYEAFLQREKTEEDFQPDDNVPMNFDIPELRHNLDLLVNITEEAIIRNDRQLKFLKDQNVSLKYEEKELKSKIQKEQAESDSLKQLLDLLDEFNEKAASEFVTLEDCRKLVEKLQDKFYAEYKMFSLSDLAITNVLPLFKEKFSGWHVLDEPTWCLDEMLQWKLLIEQPGQWVPRGSNLDDMDPYHRIVWEAWMPHLRRATLQWDPRDCDKMIKFTECWIPALPAWILENVLEQIILPRIQREVDDWDPTTDRLPIHSWLHPWLPLMGDRLQPVYGPIRHKLGRALSQWEPRDASAKKILKPWRDVFAAGTYDCFLAQHILPKLQLTLAQFKVNPANQQLEAWRWVMDWLDLINTAHLANALVEHFFPKWLMALYKWLTCPNVNYNEVSHWYSGWKSLIHADLLAFPSVKDQMNKGLEMMNTALSGGQITPPTKISYIQEFSIPETSTVKVASQSVPATFKDLLDQKAKEHNLLFMPIPNKFADGKQVYKFGTSQIYIDRNVAFMFNNNHWIPVSVEQLIISSG